MAQAGDSIEVIYKPDHSISIKDLFSAKSGERSKINEIKVVPQLSTEFKEWSEKIAATQH
jgi:MOSC domain-containing protein YiiM